MRASSLLALLLLMLTDPTLAAESVATSSPRAIVTLISDTDAPARGEPFRVGLRLRMAPGWHIYWKNSGDSGLPPEIALDLPEGTTISAIAWPAPQRLPEGEIVTYGYTGEVLLPITLTPGASPGPITATRIQARATWLICEKICVPEDGSFHLDLPTGPGVPSTEATLFAAAEAVTPRPLPGTASIAPDGGLAIHTLEFTRASVREAWFFPAVPGPIAHSKDQILEFTTTGLLLRLPRAEGFRPETPLAGVLVVTGRSGQRDAFDLIAAAGPLPAAGLSLAQAMVFAFLGGLILNLMPCVFPVLAMKALALASLAQKERAHIRIGALFFMLGNISAFAILAGALLAARATGAAVGWGFQFQSPIFVALMAWLFLVIGLNLSGVFQVSTRLAGAGHSLTARGGAAGNFATGLLAAVVATPCTAPFMGAAIAVALSEPLPVTLGVFLAMGIGLGTPYAVFALIPGCARLLPRPGAWMEVLKQALAFPMYAAAIWLVWVLSQSLGSPGVLIGLAGALLLGFAAWTVGWVQTAAHPKPSRLARAPAVLAVLGALALLSELRAEPPASAPTPEAGSEAYSPTRLATLRAEGKAVFVNMTAAWCITCLVNERIALAPAAIRAAFTERKIVYLKGDWTRQDRDITAFLRQHGRDGVPLYVFYPQGKDGQVLPQLLTEGTVLAAIGAN